ncbi:MAG: hypothetical protein AB1918_07245 [Pseudomonadota bacterium]
MRTAVKWAILFATPVVVLVMAGLGYYAFAKLTYPAGSCGSVARFDDEIGWILASEASTCIEASGRDGEAGFRFTIHTDVNGFRSASPGGETPVGGLLAVGDSWTFGFGVDYPDAYPARLAQASGLPVVTVASPAYSAAQALLLAERWAGRLRPRAMVFLDRGFWNRAACSGSDIPTAILKPCYWQPPGGGEAHLVVPPPGYVTTMARRGIMPGGILGVGETGWVYFLVSRPLAQLHQLLVRAGLASGFGHDFRPVNVDENAIKAATLAHLGRLALRTGVPVVFLDPMDQYAGLMDRLPPEQAGLIHRVGQDRWQVAIGVPTQALPPEQAYVPSDGHYGPGSNRLIGQFVARELATLGVQR